SDTLSLELFIDGRNARVPRIGAVHIGAAAISVLRVVVVGVLDRIRIFDLVAKGHARRAIWIGEEGGIAADEHLEIGSGASHDALMVIVAAGVGISQSLEDRGVSRL